MIRSRWFLTVGVLLLTWSLHAQVTLDSLIATALKQNPDLQSRRLAESEMEARISPAGVLPDPVVSIGVLNLPVDSYAFDREPMSGKKLSFTQGIPFPGKLGLKADLVRHDAQIARLATQKTRLDIILQIRLTWYTIHFLDRALEITEKNKHILENFVSVAATKYSVGKGLQQDVLKAQVELSKFEDKLIALRKQRDTEITRLNYLLGRSEQAPFPVTPVTEFVSIRFNMDSLKSDLQAKNPVLNMVREIHKKYGIKTRLARRNYWPDFSLSVAYTQRDVLKDGNGGTDYVSGVVGVKVPLYFWKKQKHQVQEAQIGRKKVEEILRNTENKLMNELEDAWQQFNKEKHIIELYRNGIIPQASQSLNSSISGYQTDKVDFLTMLNNLMVLFNYEKEYYNVLSNYYKHIARIKYLTAVDNRTHSEDL